jgi:hypothetical protein
MSSKIRRLLISVGAILLVMILGYIALRPFHLRWGAADEDLDRAMPGDLSGARWTRAVTISASPEQIWPWLVQFGQGRGGWYSYDWLENLLGFDIHTAGRILPEHQNAQIGTPICMSAAFCPSAVHVIEPYRWFGWQARGDQDQAVWTFVFGLIPLDDARTRLVVRESFDPAFMPAPAVVALEIPDTVMELKMLDTLKWLAEGRSPAPWTTAAEIFVWLAILAAGLAVWARFISRGEWTSAISGGAIFLVLELVTLLFPPLWLRWILLAFVMTALAWNLQRISGPRVR